MAPVDYDLVVIGSGGGAFAGAIRAHDLGRTVLMVEQGTTGGTCVNVGCIPSKALLVRSERAALTGFPTLREAVASKDGLVERLRQTKYIDLLAEYGIDFRPGHARLTGPHVVEVDGEPVSAGAILLATGARPAVPPIPGLEAAGFLTSTEALELDDAPPRLAVLGAGPVGLELGQMLGNFGSQVTFMARRDIAPRAEPEVSAELRDALEGEGHRVLARAITTEVSVDAGDKLLRGHTDGKPCTSMFPIYAAGDVTNQPRFVYVAAAAGAAAAQNALAGGDERLDFAALPQIVFTSPAIAQAGITEADARERGLNVATTVLPLEAIPRALVNGDTRGLFKLIAETGSGRLLGTSILAAGAPDVIQSAVLAIARGMTVDELARTWAPYLTMAEGLKLAAQTFERDVSKLSCCAA